MLIQADFDLVRPQANVSLPFFQGASWQIETSHFIHFAIKRIGPLSLNDWSVDGVTSAVCENVVTYFCITDEKGRHMAEEVD